MPKDYLKSKTNTKTLKSRAVLNTSDGFRCLTVFGTVL